MEAGMALVAIGWAIFMFLLVPYFAIRANGRAKALEAEVRVLKTRIGLLERGAFPSRTPEAEAVPPIVSRPPAEKARPTPAAVMPETVESEAPPPPPPPTRPVGDAASAAAPMGIEQRLASRWIVWVGTLAVVLGGAFLVKHSIENGWLGPMARIAIAFVTGVVLVLVGEYLRRCPMERAIASIQPNYVPQALAASGISVAFAAVYASYGLYDLVPGIVAAAGMAVIALGAVGLSILHGPFLALIGLVGGFVTPILVATGHPVAAPLFAYLAVLVGACILVVRFMGWWWLAYCGIAGAAFWAGEWMAMAWHAGDAIVLGPFLLAVLGGFTFGLGQPSTPRGPGDLTTWSTWAVVTALAFALVRVDAYGFVAVGVLVVLAALGFFVAARRPRFEFLPLLPAVATVLLLAAWQAPELAGIALRDIEALWAIDPDKPRRTYMVLSAIFGALFAIGGFGGLPRGGRPVLWAGISTVVPLAIFTLAYWRMTGFATDYGWASTSLALAALSVTTAWWIGRGRGVPKADTAIAIYAAATCAFLGLAFAMTLREAWLTVALALEVPALAWIGGRLDVRVLRPVAAVLAGIVFCRLALNWNVFDYALGATPGFGWVLYGYGVPAVAFMWSAYRFKEQGDDWLVAVLEALGLLFATLLVALEIRIWIEGAIDSSHYGFLERGLQGAVWLIAACGLVLGYRRHGRTVLLYGGYVLGLLGTAQAVLVQTLIHNPVFTHEPVGDWPIVNLLLLGYALPAAATFVLARSFDHAGNRQRAIATAVSGGILAFTYVTLEVKRAFQGGVLQFACQSDAEFYAYSAVWLVMAVGVLGLGIWRRSTLLRYVSLGLLVPTVAKVFLADMSGLDGLYRIISFFGLGLSLIAIGLVYQRFVFAPRNVAEGADDEATRE